MYVLLSAIATQIPTGSRSFFVVLVGLSITAFSAPISAQEPTETLTEAEVLERVLANDSITDGWEARVQIARSEVWTQGAWANPEIGFTREQIFDEPEGSAENSLEVGQILPISGRPGLLADAAGIEADAVALDTENDRKQVIETVRQAFYSILSGQLIIESYDNSLDRMAETIEQMSRRVEAGEGSEYELERLSQQQANLEAEREIEIAELQRQQATLAGWFSGDGQATEGHDLRASGELLPSNIPSDNEIVEGLTDHPMLAASDQRIEATGLRREAAARWWIPDLLLRAGIKSESAVSGQNFGFMAGIGMSIPIFDRRRGEAEAAQATILAETSERNLNRDLLTARALGLAEETTRLKEAADDFRKEGVARARRVLRLAEQSYEAGEAGILEVVDAHRSLLDARSRELNLALRCRRQYVELQTLLGFGDFADEDGTYDEGE